MSSSTFPSRTLSSSREVRSIQAESINVSISTTANKLPLHRGQTLTTESSPSTARSPHTRPSTSQSVLLLLSPVLPQSAPSGPSSLTSLSVSPRVSLRSSTRRRRDGGSAASTPSSCSAMAAPERRSSLPRESILIRLRRERQGGLAAPPSLICYPPPQTFLALFNFFLVRSKESIFHNQMYLSRPWVCLPQAEPRKS